MSICNPIKTKGLVQSRDLYLKYNEEKNRKSDTVNWMGIHDRKVEYNSKTYGVSEIGRIQG